ncbi:MAG: hypothetical protein AAF437_00590 [Pseudomonadota bacterium]
MRGWAWLLDRDGVRIAGFASVWALVKFGLFTLDHMIGLNQGMGLFSTTYLADPFFIGVIYLVALRDDGSAPGDVLQEAGQRYPALLMLTLLSGIGIGLGTLMLILPGIALAILWSIAMPVMLAEQKGPIEALSASFDYVRNHFWPVFGVYFLYVAGVILFSLIFIFSGLSSETGAPGLGLVLDSVIDTAMTVLGIFLGAAIFRELAFTGRHDVNVFD